MEQLSPVTTRYAASLEKYTENPSIANSIIVTKTLSYGGYKLQSMKFKCEFQNKTKTIPILGILLIT